MHIHIKRAIRGGGYNGLIKAIIWCSMHIYDWRINHGEIEGFLESHDERIENKIAY